MELRRGRHLPRRLANDAMRGEQRAIKFLLSLLDHYGASPQTKLQLGEMLAEDAEILAQYLQDPAASFIESPGIDQENKA